MHKIKKAALPLCFVLLLGVVLNTTADVFKIKESAEHYSEFWKGPEEYDVWFMGTSHVYYSVHPMQLWKQYGIRSYNLAAPSSPMTQVYWTMMCALQYSQPKVIVLDTYKVHLDTKRQEDKAPRLLHVGIDSIPLSGMKIKGICDIFDTWGERFEYICGFSIYHSRWEELSESDFAPPSTPMKGGRFKTGIEDRSDFQNIAKEDMSDADTVGFLYLEKIIEECRERGIELILTELPFSSTPEQQRAMNAVPQLAEKYGLVCLNMAYEENLLDCEVDFGDGAHVNLFGAEKITNYLGDYLVEHYDLTDYRKTPEIAERWNADYESYLCLKTTKLWEADRIKSYVQWLKDDRYTCYMYAEKEPADLLAKELAQLNNITHISRKEAEERMGGNISGEYAFFVENDRGELVDRAVFKKEKRQ